MFKFEPKFGAILFINAFLVACGGGGGSDSTGTGTGSAGASTTVASSSVISQANYANAAAAGLSPVGTLTGLSSIAGLVATGVEIEAPSLSLADASTRIYLGLRTKTSRLVTGAVVTEACSGGGSITVSDSVASESSLSVGDRFSINANNCTEAGLPTLNGAASFRITSVSGDPVNTNNYGLGIAITYSNLALVEGAERVVVDGDLALNVSQNGSSNIDVSLSGNALTVTVPLSGTNNVYRLTSYRLSGTDSNGIATFSGAYTLSGSSAELGAYTYKVETLTPMIQSASSEFPSSGSMIVRGSPASVTLTALNSSSARLDYSLAGDGVISASRTLSWTEFDAL